MSTVSAVGWRALVIVAALTALVVIVQRWTGWVGGSGWQETDDAYLAADITPVSAKVGGYVRAVPTTDFDHVSRGQLIAEIVDDDYKALVAQAEANVASAQAQAAALEAQIAVQAATVAAARAVAATTSALIGQNDRDMARQQRLLTSGSSTAEAGERLQTAKAQLGAQLDQNRAQISAAEKQAAVLSAQLRQAEAAIAAQQASLTVARLNLGYTRIVAPQAGELGQRQVRPGQYVTPGTQITTLTPLPKVWVIANYKETQLTHVEIGQKSEIRVDAFPGVTLQGRVASVSPASGSQFALLPPDNATGNFTKVVQRVAVKIEIDDGGAVRDRLRAGMSVVARVLAVERSSR